MTASCQGLEVRCVPPACADWLIMYETFDSLGERGELHCCIHGNPPCTSERETRDPETETKQSETKTETERDEAD